MLCVDSFVKDLDVAHWRQLTPSVILTQSWLSLAEAVQIALDLNVQPVPAVVLVGIPGDTYFFHEEQILEEH